MNDKLITNTKVNFYEYKKIRKLFPSAYLKKILIVLIILAVLDVMLFLPPSSVLFEDVITVNIFILFITAIIFKFIDIIFVGIYYKIYLKKNYDCIDYTLTFYKDYFEKSNASEKIKIKYNDIKKVKETNENFYMFLKNKSCVIVMKRKCSIELIEFINNTILNIGKNVQYSKTRRKSISKEDPKYKKIKISLIILFIVTIASLWIGLFIAALLSQLFKGTTMFFGSYVWILYFCLPIPILSIIFGIFYKYRGMKCTKNIVGGILMTILLMFFGSFAFDFNFEVDYDEIVELKEIIGVSNIPTKGTYSKINWDRSYFLNHITHYIVFSDIEENKKFNDDIIDNSNWVKTNNLTSEMVQILPSSLKCEPQHKCYYAIYIEELKQYNTYPTVSQLYHIYAMQFDYNSSTLLIEEYNYDYKNMKNSVNGNNL